MLEVTKLLIDTDIFTGLGKFILRIFACETFGTARNDLETLHNRVTLYFFK